MKISAGSVWKSIIFIPLIIILTFTVNMVFAQPLKTFFTDFEAVPIAISGISTTEAVQGYAGLGNGSNVFTGKFLRNSSVKLLGANAAASKTTLKLSNLPPHKSIDLNFLLAIIDSWDGNCAWGPDSFNVAVDGQIVFSQTFGCSQSYVPPQGVQIARDIYLGFNPVSRDSAYDMGLDTAFDKISHTSSDLVVEWYAGGTGWQGGNDESWAIDNVEVLLNETFIPIKIDVKPDSYPNIINPKSKGRIPVAVLTTKEFDARKLNKASIRFGLTGTEAAPAHVVLQDVDKDGDKDMFFQFNISATGIKCGSTAVHMRGKTLDDWPIEGSDSIITTGCK